ncbi:hypothetical protein [Crassaminicella profunda]|nr:hypothetical protein [Crassaminicella profunda]
MKQSNITAQLVVLMAAILWGTTGCYYIPFVNNFVKHIANLFN